MASLASRSAIANSAVESALSIAKPPRFSVADSGTHQADQPHDLRAGPGSGRGGAVFRRVEHHATRQIRSDQTVMRGRKNEAAIMSRRSPVPSFSWKTTLSVGRWRAGAGAASLSSWSA
jgi:hypothetical protein